MITVRLNGGLGNQMFQYAFGRSVVERLNKKGKVELGLDVSGYDDPRYAVLNTARKYSLGVFDIKARALRADEAEKFNGLVSKLVRRIKFKLFPEKTYAFDPRYLKHRDGDYLFGYWQSEKYFIDVKDDIRKEFALIKPFGPEASKYEGLIKRAPLSVSVHIRRSDYFKDPNFKDVVCGLEYYMHAFEHIVEVSGHKPSEMIAFIFSDDIEWARANLKLPRQMIFVSEPGIKDYEEMALMSKCVHNIIANSSFSWWGAWLNSNPNKIVVAPKQWATAKIPTPDIIPSTWTRL